MKQKNYGGKNYQVQANEIGHVGDVQYLQPNGKEYLRNGVELLNRKSYVEASAALRKSIQADSNLSDAFYYLAIALLEGKRPRKLDKWRVEEIESNLQSALFAGSNTKKCYTLWAIVKYGYYSMNGFIEKEETSEQLFNQGQPLCGEAAKEIMYHVSDPSNPYWVQLKSTIA
jgi:hypothetical protein